MRELVKLEDIAVKVCHGSASSPKMWAVFFTIQLLIDTDKKDAV